jgi:hypothetical protein
VAWLIAWQLERQVTQSVPRHHFGIRCVAGRDVAREAKEALEEWRHGGRVTGTQCANEFVIPQRGQNIDRLGHFASS